MSTTTSAPTLVNGLRYGLPAITILLGSGGLLGGVYTASDPVEGSRVYGIPVTPTSPASLKAYVRTLGVRNAASGAVILALTGLHGLAWSSNLPVAAATLRRAIGVAVFIGFGVGVADSWVIGKYVDEQVGGIEDDVREKANGHLFLAPVIGLIGLGWLTV